MQFSPVDAKIACVAEKELLISDIQSDCRRSFESPNWLNRLIGCHWVFRSRVQ